MKAPTRSPKRAPRGESTVNNRGYPNRKYSVSPTITPIARPKKNPLYVLFFPKMGSPSKNFFPKSMAVPPPASTGAPFAQ